MASIFRLIGAFMLGFVLGHLGPIQHDWGYFWILLVGWLFYLASGIAREFED